MFSHLKLAMGLVSLPILGLALSPAQAQSPSYHFLNFDAPGGTTTINAISNSGLLVGFNNQGANGSGNITQTDFIRNVNGTFDILNPTGSSNLTQTAMANAVNSSGTVVGTDGTNAFVLPLGGTESFLPLVNANTSSETALGINDQGTIVGNYLDSTVLGLPGFIDTVSGSTNTFTTILPPVANSTVNVQGINDNGLAVGFYTDGTSSGISHGFTYNYTTKLFTTLPDPNVPNFLFSQMLGINDSGIAAGYYGTTNNLQNGFLYNTNTGTYNFLNDPSVPLGGAAVMQITGINNAGDLAGFYTNASGTQRGFLAAPATSAVPEPAPVLLLTAGMLLLAAPLLRARRRLSQ